MLQRWWALGPSCLAGLDPNLLWLLQKQHGYSGLHQYKPKGVVLWNWKKLLFKLKRTHLCFFPLFLPDVSAISENTECVRGRGHLWASPSQIAMGSGGRRKTCWPRLLCHVQRPHRSNCLCLHPGLLPLQKRGCECVWRAAALQQRRFLTRPGTDMGLRNSGVRLAGVSV